MLVPVDGSENSLRALDLAIDFATRYGSKVYALHVKTGGEDDKKIREEVSRRASLKNIYVSYISKEYDPENSSVSNEILRIIEEEGFDTVIIGARGKTLREDLTIGSTALSILINAPVNIILIR
ncbi:MAG: universal stress protein [Desulfurococcales archaeon]|nr:universal stress protein [Desulfurococcales archaeon]MCC6061990.1 universal stress protein [Desulfurococcales archaeon]